MIARLNDHRAPLRRPATWLLSAGALLISACATQPSTPTPAPVAPVEARSLRNDELLHLAQVLNHPRRTPDYRRDGERRPFGVVSFFRLRPDMTVVEVQPGGGWYTRVLAPYVARDGRYMAVNYPPDLVLQMRDGDLSADQRAALAAFPAAWPAEVAEMMAGGAAEDIDIPGAYFLGAIPQAAVQQADIVLFMRTLHALARFDQLDAAVADAARMLKPQGLVGVVQHRAKADAPDDYADGSHGYLREVDVIAAFEAGGFQLIDSSDINANPQDSADWPAGVWTLPPRLITGEDEERYRAIGESDRMTLLFQKTAP